MQDAEIVALFLEHDEGAVSAAREKYGRYIQKIAYNFTGDLSDSEELLNDVLLRAWSSIPPQEPKDLRSYLSMLTRRAAVDLLRKRGRQKRSSEYSVSLSELEECLPGGSDPEREADSKLLAEAMNRWLNTLSQEQRTAFVCRYYYSDPISAIAKNIGASSPKVKSMLFRLRAGLKAFLEKEEIL